MHIMRAKSDNNKHLHRPKNSSQSHDMAIVQQPCTEEYLMLECSILGYALLAWHAESVNVYNKMYYNTLLRTLQLQSRLLQTE